MRVDVVIPVYGHAHLVPEAIHSLAVQEIPLSVVVVDDGNDPPIEDPDPRRVGCIERISTIRRDVNGGIAAARNEGLEHCRGEAVIFLDADDQLQPGVLARMVSALQEGDSDAVFGFVEEFGHGITASRAAKAQGEPALLAGSTLMRRSSIEVLGRFDETLGVGEFVDYMARAQRASWKFQPIHEPVLRRRIHDKNTSWSGDPADFLRVVRRHIRDAGDA